MMRATPETVNTRARRKPIGQKKSRAQRARLRYWPREADTITFQEGLLSSRATGGGGQMRNANAQRAVIIVPPRAMQQPGRPHVRHAEIRDAESGRPALRLAHYEVAEHLHARHGFQLFGINEVGVELDRVGLAEQLYKPAVFLDEVIRQRGNAEALLARAHQTENAVDLEIGLARAASIAARLDQPAAVGKMLRHLGIAEHDDAVRIELFQRAGGAEALDVVRRAIGVDAHREQLALDQVGLRRLAGADRDV